MKKTYYIYRIPGKKVGVTSNIERRMFELGNPKYQILRATHCIDEASVLEIEFQKAFGYRTDPGTYKETIEHLTKNNNQMKLHRTEHTLTFPCTKDKLLEYALNNMHGKLLTTKHKALEVDQALIDWLVENSFNSMYKGMGCYVYIDALEKYAKNLIHEVQEPNKQPVNTFDRIREWAEDRGIYAKGDSKTQYCKLMEEGGELARAILKRDIPEIKDAIGDMVVVLTNLAHLEGFTIEECIESAYDVISRRQGKMVNGTFVKESDNIKQETL
jgi:NTP pyrophosphatase (non-canonical NTP hydrolase)